MHKALFLFNSVNIKNSGGYTWTKTSNLKEEVNNTFLTYTVRMGDTLSGIARTFKTTVQELARINNISNVNLIYVGQVLKLTSNNNYFNKYTGNSNSLVDALKSVGSKTDYTYRTRIANLNGIINYRGTGTQNNMLLNLLKQGKLLKV